MARDTSWVSRARESAQAGAAARATGRRVERPDQTKDVAPAAVEFLSRLGRTTLDRQMLPDGELPDIFEGEKPTFRPVEGETLTRLEEVEPELQEALLAVLDYGDGNEQLRGDELAARVENLRSLLEYVQGTKIRFKGEAARPEPSLLVVPGSAGTDSGCTWTLTNETPAALEIRGPDRPTHILPPLGERRFDFDVDEAFDLATYEAENKVSVVKWNQRASDTIWALLGFVFLLFPVALVAFIYLRVGKSTRDIAWYPWAAWGAFIGLCLLVIRVWQAKDKARMRELRADLPQMLLELLVLGFMLVIGIAGTSAAVVYGADVRPGDEALLLTGRAIQFVFLAVASLLPGLLYFLFDREHLGTLRSRFVHQIFRFDKTVATIADVEAKYGAVINESYGVSTAGRRRRANRAPIVIATLVITLGWILVILNPQIETRSDLGSLGIVRLLEPSKSAVTFGFLGAYFYALQAVMRGYVRRDLQPKFYTDIAVRIVVVVILAWMLEIAFPDDAPHLYVLAFLVGIVPEQALLFLREFVGRAMPGLDEKQRLTDLEGIDLYDRARLQSEGVTDIQALANADLIELMLRTRIPIAQLVDWTDQAILRLHVVDAQNGEHSRGSLDALRGYGIRTASDLICAWETFNHEDDDEQKAKREKFLNILGGEAGKPFRLEVIQNAIADEEWMPNLRHWHKSD